MMASIIPLYLVLGQLVDEILSQHEYSPKKREIAIHYS